ncbi:MAG: hypothetical protein LBN29_04440 [Mediterranea sp.]|jgi:hypothetical protein|nr:hypothetical protein [Mediterranea sp.]
MIKDKIYWGTACLALLLGGCTDNIAPNVDTEMEVVPISVNLHVSSTQGNGNTRIITNNAESDIESMYALSFTKKKGGTESTLTDVQEVDVTNLGGGTFKASFNIKRPKESDETCMSYVANTSSSITLESINALKGKTKEQVYDKLTFNTENKWEATSDTKYIPIPMWGEVDTAVTAATRSEEQIVNMLRALARFDVGLGFDTSHMTGETFKGIDNYELEDVHVFRIMGNARIAPDSTCFDASKTICSAPTVPGNPKLIEAGRVGSGDKGFVYNTTKENKISIVRTIYVPECRKTNVDSATVVVVGLRNTKTNHLGYYCLKNQTSKKEQKSVIRNYRYVFDVKSVSGEGQTGPLEALTAVTPGVDYTVEAYNMNNDNLYMEGHYYFKVSERAIKLFAQGEVKKLTYETNLPKSLPVKWEWDEADPKNPSTLKGVSFKVGTPVTDANDITTDTVTITAPINSTGKDIKLKLKFTAGGIKGEVNVIQPPLSMAYGIEEATLYGHYMPEDIPNRDNDYIEVTMKDIPDESLGTTWSMTTNEFNGLKFSAEGKFTQSPTQTVRLYADDKKQIGKAGRGTLTITCNSTANPAPKKEVSVLIGFSAKKILAYGDWYGAALNYGSSYSRKFVTKKENFGLDGTVPVETITLETSNKSDAITDEFIQKQKPDIILIGYNEPPKNDSQAKALKNYMDQGGVVMLFEETAGDSYVDALFYGAATHHSGHGDNDDKAGIVLNDGGALANDPIYTGNIGGHNYWGFSLKGMSLNDDGNIPNTVTPNPGHEDEIICYATSYSTKMKDDDHKPRGEWEEPVFVRYTKRHFVWIGDGGFLTGFNGTEGTRQPFSVDANFRPRRRYYEGKKNWPCDNSFIFANMLTWAIYEAEYHGYNTGGLSSDQ